jgi:RNA polymerase sigma factor (sigma-70 family)
MAGQRFQFEELFLPHLDGAYNFAYWLTQSDSDAQAVVTQAYLLARQEFEKFGDVDARIGLLTDARIRLLTIVRRVARLRDRKGAKHKIVLFSEPFLDPHSATHQHLGHTPPEVVSTVVDQESKRVLYEALSRLPLEFREVLLLHEIEELNYNQAAAVLEISPDAFLNQLNMARRSLRHELGETRG